MKTGRVKLPFYDVISKVKERVCLKESSLNALTQVVVFRLNSKSTFLDEFFKFKSNILLQTFFRKNAFILQRVWITEYSHHLNTKHLNTGQNGCPVIKCLSCDLADHLNTRHFGLQTGFFCPVLRPPFEYLTIWQPDTNILPQIFIALGGPNTRLVRYSNTGMLYSC